MAVGPISRLMFITGTCLLIILIVDVGPSQSRLYEPTDVEINAKRILGDLLFDYDRRLRPNYGGKPVDVAVSVYIETLGPISEDDMTFTLEFYLRQWWNDPGLQFNSTLYNGTMILSPDSIDYLWVPDIVFLGEISASFHDVTKRNANIRVKHNGDVFFTQRITLTVNCALDLTYFPMDTQTCIMRMNSYGYADHDLKLTWVNEDYRFQLDPHVALSQLFLDGWDTYNTTSSYISGDFTELVAEFYFRRDVMYYLLSSYFPSIMIVIISWVTFWIQRTSTTARAGLGITTVLSILTLILGNAIRGPKVAYVKAIDIYITVCFLYVFGALVEFSIVCYFDTKRKERDSELGHDAVGGSSTDVSKGQDKKVLMSEAGSGKQRKKSVTFMIQQKVVRNVRPSKIDFYSRILFPATFILFNIIYWLSYPVVANFDHYYNTFKSPSLGGDHAML